jgi:YHS domain-containing protein
MFTKIFVVAIAAGVLLSTAASLLSSTEPEQRSHFFADRHGVALGGHDPVAYFTRDEAVPGKLSVATRHQGATFRFADKYHRRAFLVDPATYVPEFAGAGAWAVSEGFLAVANPRDFEIIDGRLYLFVNEEARQRFRVAPEKRIAAARAKWPTVLAEWAREDEGVALKRLPQAPRADPTSAVVTADGSASRQAGLDAGPRWTVTAGAR